MELRLSTEMKHQIMKSQKAVALHGSITTQVPRDKSEYRAVLRHKHEEKNSREKYKYQLIQVIG